MKPFFDRLRGKKIKPLAAQVDASSIPLPDDQLSTDSWNGLHIEPQQFISGCGQSIGKQREHNEDSLFALTAAMGGETNSPPLGLFIVADGPLKDILSITSGYNVP